MQSFYTLLDAGNTAKPVLVFGPPHSGKKTRLRQALRGRCYQVVEHAEVPSEVPGVSLFGRLAHIVDADTLRLPKTHPPSVLLIYVCFDPFRWATQAELRARFNLIDLSKEFRTLDYETVVDARDKNSKQAPWHAIQALCYAKTFEEKIILSTANPNILELLRNNAPGLGSLEQIDRLYRWLSETGSVAYSMKAETKLTMDTLKAMQELRITPDTRLQYGGWKPAPYVGKFEKNYDVPAILKEPAGSKKKKKRKPAPSEGNEPKRRAPPQCKACQVPLKGHGSCPLKTKK